MEDWQYLLCLAGVVFCAICGPVYCVRTLAQAKAKCAIIASLSIVSGVALALPWRGTQELAWLPMAAQVYFGTTLLSTLLYALGRLLQIRVRD